LFTLSCSAKTHVLAAVLVYQLGNFGRDTFQLDVELVDNVCSSG
jgi:hypothetical protein